ncbi:MAG: DUF4442 domain-containing protein [Alphaproteobacteria bacterium]|nr:DUF4442 domain-containing protein [Alphaproteobacteria bacterium]
MNATPTPALDDAKIDKALATMRRPLAVWGFNLAKMPLGVAAGLRVDHIDATSCTVSLPGGWRTQNPFNSMYWAAQGMAAEMATGVHGYVLTQAAPVPVRMILSGCQGEFTRMCKGRGRFVFEQGALVRSRIEETLATGAALTCDTEVIGYDPGGEQVSRWTFTWAFRARLEQRSR